MFIVKYKSIVGATLITMGISLSVHAVEIPRGGHISIESNSNQVEGFNPDDYSYIIRDDQGQTVLDLSSQENNIDLAQTDDVNVYFFERNKSYTITFYKNSEGPSGEGATTKSFTIAPFGWDEFLSADNGYGDVDYVSFNNFVGESYSSSELFYELPNTPYPNPNPTGSMEFPTYQNWENNGINISDWSSVSGIQTVGGSFVIETESDIDELSLSNLTSVGGRFTVATRGAINTNITLDNLTIANDASFSSRSPGSNQVLTASNMDIGGNLYITGLNSNQFTLGSNVSFKKLYYTSVSGSSFGSDLTPLTNVSFKPQGGFRINSDSIDSLNGMPIISNMYINIDSASLSDISVLSGVTSVSGLFLRASVGALTELTSLENISSVLYPGAISIFKSHMASGYTKMNPSAYLCTAEEDDDMVGRYFNGYSNTNYLNQAQACDCPDYDANGLCNVAAVPG